MVFQGGRRAVRSGRYTGMSNGQLALMLAGLGYVVSPVDLVPEGLLLSRAAVERSYREFQTYFVAKPGGHASQIFRA